MRFKRFAEARSAWEDQVEEASLKIGGGFYVSARLKHYCDAHEIKLVQEDPQQNQHNTIIFKGSKRQLEDMIDDILVIAPKSTVKTYKDMIKEARSAWEDQEEEAEARLMIPERAFYAYHQFHLYCRAHQLKVEYDEAGHRTEVTGPRAKLEQMLDDSCTPGKDVGFNRGDPESKKYSAEEWKKEIIEEARSAWEDQEDDSSIELNLDGILRDKMLQLCKVHGVTTSSIPWTDKRTLLKLSGAKDDLEKVIEAYWKNNLPAIRHWKSKLGAKPT